MDNLVIIDDSIVRGTTLKESILRILDRLHPKKIVVVSSAPQIRYPDYYGIDMARLEEFCVFRAAIQLLKERKMEDLIEQTYEACKAELAKPKEEQINPVRSIYKPFSTEEIIYIEADGKITTIYCDTSGIVTTTPYIQISQQLPEEYFITPHRSFAVNMMHIREFDQNQLILDNNVAIPLSRRRKMDFFIKFNEFTRSHNFLN